MIPATLYGHLLGDAYRRLPQRVAMVHARDGRRRYVGEVEVRRGASPLSRLCAWATRLPPAGAGPIHVDIDADRHGERWIRHVAGHAMPSRLRAHAGRLRERLGLVTFDFDLHVDAGQLRWSVAAVHVFGLPLPRGWFEGVEAIESERDGRYRFDVRATLPFAGLLVHYTGWLDVD